MGENMRASTGCCQSAQAKKKACTPTAPVLRPCVPRQPCALRRSCYFFGAAAFFATVFFAGAFLATVFLAATFFAGAFFATAFLATAFFATVFFAATFFVAMLNHLMT